MKGGQTGERKDWAQRFEPFSVSGVSLRRPPVSTLGRSPITYTVWCLVYCEGSHTAARNNAFSLPTPSIFVDPARPTVGSETSLSFDFSAIFKQGKGTIILQLKSRNFE